MCSSSSVTDPTCLRIQRYRFCSLQCCPTAPAILAAASSSPRCPYRDPHPLPSAITFFPLPSATLLFLCHLPLQPPTPSSPPHRLPSLLSVGHLSSSPPLQQLCHPQPLPVTAKRRPFAVAILPLQPISSSASSVTIAVSPHRYHLLRRLARHHCRNPCCLLVAAAIFQPPLFLPCHNHCPTTILLPSSTAPVAPSLALLSH
ncbi:hypothetical protein BHM03_00056464 [Ensete ventricosum]|nr:hypothetical protein BHM03_00056464 [Ensete ventricosum]